MKENNKSKLLYGIVIVVIVILLARLTFVQVADGSYYRDLSNYRSLRIVSVEPLRGRILDRNGIVLAENIPSYNLEVIPEDFADENNELNFLSGIIKLKTDDIKEIIEKSGLPDYEDIIIKKDITKAEMVVIQEHSYELPGVKVVLSSKRYYPYGSIGECFLGYIGQVTQDDLKTDSYYDQNDTIGKAGIELEYEKYLRGIKGETEILVDAQGRVKKVLYEQSPVMGDDVYLSIDINFQKELEKTVGDRKGVSIAMDPKTGQILAMVSHPTFDPNLFVNGISEADYNKLSNEDAFINRAIQSSFPPGSTFKPLTLISALESNTITSATTLYCGNSVNIGGRIFRDWIYPQAFGYQNPVQALANSCDVFFYKVGVMTGIDQISKYANMLKVDQKTGIDIPFETTGLVPNPSWKLENTRENWYVGDTANTSIGQGYDLFTPIELITFYQMIANNGVQYTPHFLLKILSSENEVVFEYNNNERLNVEIPQDVFKTIKDGMEELSNKPDMQIVKVSGVTVCSKTGTAEVGDNSVDHWLVSFAPKENAKVIGLFFFEKSDFPSSHSLAPLMRDLLKNFF
jgi:penicillin-binding protein 2